MARGFLLAFAHPRTLDSSLDAFQRAITLDPKNAEAHHQYGQVLAWLGRLGDADRQYHQALALDPSRMMSYNDLAYAVHYRDTALAVALADSAVALDPLSRRTPAPGLDLLLETLQELLRMQSWQTGCGRGTL